jgi:carboxypeptidase family protein
MDYPYGSLLRQLMRRLRRFDVPLVLSILSLWATGPLTAQRPAVFRGLITDSARVPIPGVEVTMREAHAVARTDSAGVFVLRGIAPGTYSVIARHPLYQPLEGTVRLSEGDSVDYRMPRMRRLVRTLDTIRVHDSSMTPWWQSDFQRRKAAEHGSFITREMIDQRATWSLPNIIASKATGVKVVQRRCGTTFCGWAVASSRPGSCLRPGCSPLCFLAVFLDGQPIFLPSAAGGDGIDLTTILPSDVAAVEVYDSPAAIPPIFNTTGAACGVIALWSRTTGTALQ